MTVGPNQIDSVQPYSVFVSASQIRQIPTTVVTCFRPQPDGSMRTEIQKVEIQGNQGTVTNVAAKFVSIDPACRCAHLRTHFTVSGTTSILAIIPYSFQQDFYMEGNLQMAAPNVILVQGDDFFAQNGNVLARVWFHAEAHRVVQVKTAN